MASRWQIDGGAPVPRTGPVGRYVAWLAVVLVLIVGAAALTPAIRAQAITTSPDGWDQVTVLKGGTPEFAVGDFSTDFPYARELFNAYNAELSDVNAAVQSQADAINAAIQSGGSSIDAHLTSLAAKAVDDHLALSFTGDGSGNVTANFTLPTIQVYLKVSAILETSGTLVVNIGPVKGSATYNVDSGTVNNVTISSTPVSVVSASADSGPYLGNIISLILSSVTGVPLPGAGFVFTAALNSIFTSLLKSFVQGEINQNEASLFPFVTGPFPTSFGLNNILNQIPSTLVIGGTNVRQYLTDAINTGLTGQLISIAIGGTESGALIGAPWFNNVEGPELISGTHSGQNVLTITVSDIELQVVHEADAPDATTVSALEDWQQCQLGLMSSADCSLAENTGAAIITMNQQILQYLQGEASIQAEINALLAQYGGNPPLGAPYAELEALEGALYQFQVLLTPLYQSLDTAHVCIANASAPSAQCVSLYG